MGLTVLIAGKGKVGSYLGSLLLEKNHRVKIIEELDSEISMLQHSLPDDIIIKGNPINPQVLVTAGIKEADIVAAVTRSDEINLVITSLARFEYNVPRTVARVNVPKNAWLFTPVMGVDIALNQADLMAHIIAEEITFHDMKTLLKLQKGQYSLIEKVVHERSDITGKTIREINIPAECVFSAIIRKGNLIIPKGSTMIQPGDEILAVAHVSVLEDLDRLIGLT